MPDALCAVAQFVQVLTSAEYVLFSTVASAAWSLGRDETRASWEALQLNTALSRRTVSTAMKALEEKGALVLVGRARGIRAAIYRVPCLTDLLGQQAGLRPDPVPLGRGANSAPLAAELVPLGRGANFAPLGDQKTPRGATFAPLADLLNKESLTHPPTVKESVSEKVSACSGTCRRVAEAVKQVFGFEPSPSDPKIVELTKRIEQLALPVASLARYLRHVQQKKRRDRYTVESFGAVFGWAITRGDLFAWIRQQDSRMFELDQQIEHTPALIDNAPAEAAPLQNHISLEENIATVERCLEVFPNHLQSDTWRAELATLRICLRQQQSPRTIAAGGHR